MMTFQQAQIRAAHLRDEIQLHNRRYYIENTPFISDFEFDLLMQELEGIEKKFPQLLTTDSPTQRVGSDIESGMNSNVHSDMGSGAGTANDRGFARYEHKYPMLSLSNTYNQVELMEFDQRIRKSTDTPFHYVCELKFDGTAICLTYEKGRLVRALTRGDGAIGDDVLQNVLTIKGIPAHLKGFGYPEEFEIRGEIFLPFEAFDCINQIRQQEEEPLFANPRNAAAGSLKMLDKDEVAKRGLRCYLYHLIGDDLPSDSHSELLEMATEWGLPVLKSISIDDSVEKSTAVCHTLEDVFDFIHQWDKKRHALPFAIDGVVIKVNELPVQRALGMTAKSPRWATAFKYKAEQAETLLLSVDYQVGRTGSITPVANLEPVLLSGTVVKRASLHNAEQIAQLDIRINDTVVVEKGGEIIPKITAVIPEMRPAEVIPIQFITHCPQCGTLLVKEETEAKSFCPNTWACPPQIKGRILHFMSRKAMNILGGEALVEQLFDKKMVTTVSDLYHLSREQLLTLDNFGEKSADNLLESIDASRSVPFLRVLFALGIRNIGETTAKSLASSFASIYAIEQATDEVLQARRDVGEVLVRSIRAFFAHPQNQIIIQELTIAGVQLETSASPFTSTLQSLKGLQFVISGVFSIPREEIKILIEQHGGKVMNQPSAQTDYLVCGANPGSAKLQKAAKSNITVISQEELYTLIQSTQ